MTLTLRQEFEYRIRTAVAYGKGVQKWGVLTSQQQADWIQEQISLAVNARAAAGSCPHCEAVRGDNDHCVYDGTAHVWHRCDGIAAPDSNCPMHDGFHDA